MVEEPPPAVATVNKKLSSRLFWLDVYAIVKSKVVTPLAFVIEQESWFAAGEEREPIKGMYGQNVFLKGQLTTEVPAVAAEIKPTYAGINSNSGVKLSDELKEKISRVNDGYKDESYIIFWGGAKNASELGIQGSKFIVTEESLSKLFFSLIL